VPALSETVPCHLREQFGEKRDLFDEAEMLGYPTASATLGACLLAPSHVSREHSFQGVNDNAKTFEIYRAVFLSLEFMDRCLEFGEGCALVPQHEKSLPNGCSEGNTLPQ